mgnify:CR=1 FL=1
MVGYFGQILRAKMGSLQSFFHQIPPKTLKQKCGRMAGSSELCFGHGVDLGPRISKGFFFVEFPISLPLNEDSNLQYFSKEKFHLKIFLGEFRAQTWYASPVLVPIVGAKSTASNS